MTDNKKMFELKLLNQYWLNGTKDYSNVEGDITSHGKILLMVDGDDISGCDDLSTDYGINQSAVALLQTVFIDHIPSFMESRSGWPIIFHGCSIYGSCPKCIIDFRVKHHSDETVILDQFYVNGGPMEANPERYINKSIMISNIEYAKDILLFTQTAYGFLPPNRGDRYEIPLYKALRNEIMVLCSMVETYITNGQITEQMRQRANAFNLNNCELKI